MVDSERVGEEPVDVAERKGIPRGAIERFDGWAKPALADPFLAEAAPELKKATSILRALGLPNDKQMRIAALVVSLPTRKLRHEPEAQELAGLLLPIVDGDRFRRTLQLLRIFERAKVLPSGTAAELEAARRQEPNPFLDVCSQIAWELTLPSFDPNIMGRKGRPSERLWAVVADCIADELKGQRRIWPTVAALLGPFAQALNKKFSFKAKHLRKVVVGYRKRDRADWQNLKRAFCERAFTSGDSRQAIAWDDTEISDELWAKMTRRRAPIG